MEAMEPYLTTSIPPGRLNDEMQGEDKGVRMKVKTGVKGGGIIWGS
jgi:hypothetical protein